MILDARGQQITTSSERRTIPVVGGPFDGLKLVRKTDRPLMRIPVPSDEGTMYMMFVSQDGRYRWRGWGDHSGEIIAKEGSDKCASISRQYMEAAAQVRAALDADDTPLEPVKFDE